MVPRRAIDPDGIRRLATLLDECGGELVGLWQRSRALGAAEAFDPRHEVLRWAQHHALRLRTAASLVDSGVVGPVDWLPVLGLYGLPSDLLAAHPAEVARARAALQTLLDQIPAQASVGERADAVAAWFARRTPRERVLLVLTATEALGNLDGVPNVLRYAANRIAVQRTLEHERARLDAWRPPPPRNSRAWVEYSRLIGRVGLYQRLLSTRAVTAMPPGGGRENTGPAHDILVFSPPQWSGGRVVDDGRLAVVAGDLDRASSVAVLVPGITTRIDTFDRVLTGAHRLHEGGGDGTAVVAWLGYDTPEYADAVLTDRAEEGAPALHAFVTGMRRAAGSSVTVVAHSYGTLVTSYALREGMRPDRVVLMGSPGLGRDIGSVTDLGLPVGFPIYALRAPGDVVSYTEGHGHDPAGLPGVTRLDTDWRGTEDVTGHSAYLRAGSDSLTNVVNVIAGTGAVVTSGETLTDEGRYWTGVRRLAVGLQTECPPEVLARFVSRLEGQLQLLTTADGEVDAPRLAAGALVGYHESGLGRHLTQQEFAVHLVRSGLLEAAAGDGYDRATRTVTDVLRASDDAGRDAGRHAGRAADDAWRRLVGAAEHARRRLQEPAGFHDVVR